MTEEQKGIFREFRRILDGHIAMTADSPAKINDAAAAIRLWHPGVYAAGDVRIYEGAPYKCVKAHDSTDVPAWTPAEASLWMQYHGTTPATARAWVAPAGAHDMYMAGEYMIYTDGQTYRCKQDTVYSPDAYAPAWEVVV